MLEYCVLKSDDLKLVTVDEGQHMTLSFWVWVTLCNIYFFLGQPNLPANFMMSFYSTAVFVYIFIIHSSVECHLDVFHFLAIVIVRYYGNEHRKASSVEEDAETCKHTPMNLTAWLYDRFVFIFFDDSA